MSKFVLGKKNNLPVETESPRSGTRSESGALIAKSKFFVGEVILTLQQGNFCFDKFDGQGLEALGYDCFEMGTSKPTSIEMNGFLIVENDKGVRRSFFDNNIVFFA